MKKKQKSKTPPLSKLDKTIYYILTDVSCIVLAEGVRLDDEVLKVANDKCINVITSNLSAYDISLRLSGLGI